MEYSYVVNRLSTVGYSPTIIRLTPNLFHFDSLAPSLPTCLMKGQWMNNLANCVRQHISAMRLGWRNQLDIVVLDITVPQALLSLTQSCVLRVIIVL